MSTACSQQSASLIDNEKQGGTKVDVRDLESIQAKYPADASYDTHECSLEAHAMLGIGPSNLSAPRRVAVDLPARRSRRRAHQQKRESIDSFALRKLRAVTPDSN